MARCWTPSCMSGQRTPEPPVAPLSWASDAYATHMQTPFHDNDLLPELQSNHISELEESDNETWSPPYLGHRSQPQDDIDLEDDPFFSSPRHFPSRAPPAARALHHLGRSAQSHHSATSLSSPVPLTVQAAPVYPTRGAQPASRAAYGPLPSSRHSATMLPCCVALHILSIPTGCASTCVSSMPVSIGLLPG